MTSIFCSPKAKINFQKLVRVKKKKCFEIRHFQSNLASELHNLKVTFILCNPKVFTKRKK